MDVEDETIEQMEQTEVPMMIEDTPASTVMKRPAEGDPGEDDEKMVQTFGDFASRGAPGRSCG